MTITSSSEWHHICPTSMGGRDHPENVVLLTPREHFICHLLLFKIGNENQIYSVVCFLNTTNEQRKSDKKIRWTKFIRKHFNKVQQKKFRERNRVRSIGEIVAPLSQVTQEEDDE